MYNISQTTDEVNLGTGVYKFGLNQNVTLQSIEYKKFDNGECLNLGFIKDEKQCFGSIWKEKEPGEAIKNDAGVVTGYKNQIAIAAVIKHILKAFLTEEEITALFSETITSYEELCNKVIAAITPKKANQTIDLFLEHGMIQKGKTTSYLGMPTRMFSGYFMCAATNQLFTEETSWKVAEKPVKGLRYITAEGVVHPFVRSEKYMTQPEATGYGKANDLTEAVKKAEESAGGKINEASWE